ncbi:GlxA family transcriptional regulator [Phaeovulum sp. W22_SRMD_FR3]|uniref:GlxA family transcriptional regulator n=1 Tax=Phaeovulum sp. W22_SRMD_FR3 TaxID=3240274 RepID=UPI003F9C57C2
MAAVTARRATGMPTPDVSAPREIGFVLTPDHALMSLASAVEPLRAANLLAGRELYRLHFFASSEGFVASSCGGGFPCKALATAGNELDIAFVVAGGDPMHFTDPVLIRGLRGLHARKVRLGGISGGGAILARHGLMKGRRFTLHWLHADALADQQPDLLIERALYVIDRDRYSCAGGVAALDMMCALIAGEHGADFARAVSDWFIHPRLRTADEPQQLDPVDRYHLTHPMLVAAVRLMNSHLADPLTPEHLASLSGGSPRQLQRLFQAQFKMPPMQFYRLLRLEKADQLLAQSTLSLGDIAQATGFVSTAHFSRLFAAHFGMPPARRRGAHLRG